MSCYGSCILIYEDTLEGCKSSLHCALKDKMKYFIVTALLIFLFPILYSSGRTVNSKIQEKVHKQERIERLEESTKEYCNSNSRLHKILCDSTKARLDEEIDND